MLVVLLGERRKTRMLSIGETEVCVFQDLAHDSLKGLGGIPHAEGHKRKLKNAKRGRGGNHRFLNVVRVDRNLVICSHQVNF